MTDDPLVLPAGEESDYDAVAATSGAKVLAGGLWSSLSKVLPQLFTLVQSAVAARYLGLEGMGRQSFIAFVMVSLTLVFGLGLNGALVRYVAETLGQRRTGATRSLVQWVWRIEAVAALASVAVFTVIGLVDDDLRLPWLLAGVACGLSVLNHVPYAILSGTQRWREFSTISLTMGTAGTTATVAVLAMGGGITGIFAVQAVAAGISLLWTMSLSRRILAQVAPRRGPWNDLRRPMLGFAAVNFIGFLLSLIVWRRSEFFFLKQYSTDAQIGLYSVAFAAVAALVGSIEAISTVMAPAVATLTGAGAQDRIRSGFSRALRLVVHLTLPMTAGAVVIGPAALELVYGPEYDAAAAPMLIMLAIFPVLPLMNLASAMLWGLGRIKAFLAVCAAASVLNIVLGFLLVPAHGAVGAALANSGTQVAAAIAIIVYACRTIGSVTWRFPALVRSSVAAVAAGAGGWLGLALLDGAAGIVVAIVVGIVAYALAAAAIRILPHDDAKWLDDAFGRFLGGRIGQALRRCSRPAVEATAAGPSS